MLFDDHDDDDKACGECCCCVTHILAHGLREHLERAVVHWLQTATHDPACGFNVKGDLVRWVQMEGRLLPTVRSDLVASASARKVELKDGRELVGYLVDALDGPTSTLLAVSLAGLQ